MLPLGLTAEALAAAEAEADPDSLEAGARLRERFSPELSATALTQAALRRRAVAKFGAEAAGLFFTRDGLEQASRPPVARHHAARFAAAGISRVVDLGCGIGSDAIALAAAGLEVLAVEIDPATAEVARANLGGRGQVVVGDAEAFLAAAPVRPGVGWFTDPSRRNATGRVWREADFSPSWDVVLDLLDGDRVAGVKVGPALPHRLIPPGVEAEWVSHAGTTVEAALWAGGAGTPGARRATLLHDGAEPVSLLADEPSVAPVGPVLRYVYEPDGAVIRAGAIPALAAGLGASVLDPKIAYLTSDRFAATPFASAFEVLEVLPHREGVLRVWLRDHHVGTLEIKQRGIELDPAALRRRLGPRGPESATFLITRTPLGTRVLVVERLLRAGGAGTP